MYFANIGEISRNPTKIGKTESKPPEMRSQLAKTRFLEQAGTPAPLHTKFEEKRTCRDRDTLDWREIFVFATLSIQILSKVDLRLDFRLICHNDNGSVCKCLALEHYPRNLTNNFSIE